MNFIRKDARWAWHTWALMRRFSSGTDRRCFQFGREMLMYIMMGLVLVQMAMFDIWVDIDARVLNVLPASCRMIGSGNRLTVVMIMFTSRILDEFIGPTEILSNFLLGYLCNGRTNEERPPKDKSWRELQQGIGRQQLNIDTHSSKRTHDRDEHFPLISRNEGMIVTMIMISVVVFFLSVTMQTECLEEEMSSVHDISMIESYYWNHMEHHITEQCPNGNGRE